jgi:hypothetical protein
MRIVDARIAALAAIAPGGLTAYVRRWIPPPSADLSAPPGEIKAPAAPAASPHQ